MKYRYFMLRRSDENGVLDNGMVLCCINQCDTIKNTMIKSTTIDDETHLHTVCGVCESDIVLWVTPTHHLIDSAYEELKLKVNT